MYDGRGCTTVQHVGTVLAEYSNAGGAGRVDIFPGKSQVYRRHMQSRAGEEGIGSWQCRSDRDTICMLETSANICLIDLPKVYSKVEQVKEV